MAASVILSVTEFPQKIIKLVILSGNQLGSTMVSFIKHILSKQIISYVKFGKLKETFCSFQVLDKKNKWRAPSHVKKIHNLLVAPKQSQKTDKMFGKMSDITNFFMNSKHVTQNCRIVQDDRPYSGISQNVAEEQKCLLQTESKNVPSNSTVPCDQNDHTQKSAVELLPITADGKPELLLRNTNFKVPLFAKHMFFSKDIHPRYTASGIYSSLGPIHLLHHNCEVLSSNDLDNNSRTPKWNVLPRRHISLVMLLKEPCLFDERVSVICGTIADIPGHDEKQDSSFDALESDIGLENDIDVVSISDNITLDANNENKHFTGQGGNATAGIEDVNNHYTSSTSYEHLRNLLTTDWLIIGDVKGDIGISKDENCCISKSYMKVEFPESGHSNVFYKEHNQSHVWDAEHSRDKKELTRFLLGAGCKIQEKLDARGEFEKDITPDKEAKDFDEILYKPKLFQSHQELVIAPLVSLRHYFDTLALGEIHSLQEEMIFEGLRLKSFFKVKTDASSIRLAAAGFYATGNGDETRCYSCGIMYKGWQRRDIPTDVHRRISPDCPYITGSDTRNVPIDPTASPSVRPAELMNGGAVESSGRFLNENHFTNTQGAASNSDPSRCTVPIKIFGSSNSNNNIVTSGRSYQTDVTATITAGSPKNIISNLSFSNAVYPNYSDMETRTASFFTWPQGHCKNPAELVMVGFFYAGYGDCVRCFCCGIGLRTWEAEDDPWQEHVRWRSSCDYVKLVKGEEFIAQALAGLARSSQQIDRKTTSGTGNGGQERNDASNILSRDVCKQALEMGFCTDIVRKHAGNIVQNQGTLQLDVLIERILNDEGNQEEINQEPNGRTREQTPPRILCDQQGATWPFASDSNSQHHLKNGHSSFNTQIILRSDSSGSSKFHSGTLSLMASDSGERQAEQNQWSSRVDESQARLIQVGEDTEDEGYGDSNGIEDDPADAPESLASAEDHRGGTDTDIMLTTISEENREMRESSLCKICLDDPANIVFLPCGHLVACATCTPALERCPVCRTFIRGSVRVRLTGMDSISNDALQE